MGRSAITLAAIGLMCATTVTCRVYSMGDQLHGKIRGPLYDEQPTLQSRLSALAVNNTIILTQTSCGYLEFAINWILHAEALGVTNWITIAEDDESLRYLNERCGLSPASVLYFRRYFWRGRTCGDSCSAGPADHMQSLAAQVPGSCNRRHRIHEGSPQQRLGPV